MQHRPHTLAAAVAQQHRQQLVAIEPIGLGSPGAPVHLDARGVDHDVVDALLDQPPVQPPAVAAGFVAGMHLGLRLELAALLGLAYAIQDRFLVAGVHAISARAATTIAGRQLPLLVAELEAHVQLALDRRILAVWDCLGRRHFRSPSTKSLEIPFYSSTGLARVVPHSIWGGWGRFGGEGGGGRWRFLFLGRPFRAGRATGGGGGAPRTGPGGARSSPRGTPAPGVGGGGRFALWPGGGGGVLVAVRARQSLLLPRRRGPSPDSADRRRR